MSERTAIKSRRARVEKEPVSEGRRGEVTHYGQRTNSIWMMRALHYINIHFYLSKPPRTERLLRNTARMAPFHALCFSPLSCETPPQVNGCRDNERLNHAASPKTHADKLLSTQASLNSVLWLRARLQSADCADQINYCGAICRLECQSDCESVPAQSWPV